MHRYKQIEYKAGATLEIIKCVPRGLRTGWGGKRKTKEEIAKANMRQATLSLIHIFLIALIFMFAYNEAGNI